MQADLEQFCRWGWAWTPDHSVSNAQMLKWQAQDTTPTQFLQYSRWNPGFCVSMKDLAQWGHPASHSCSSHPITSVLWVAGARAFIWLQRQRQECQDRKPACQWPPPPGEIRGKYQFLALSTGTVTHVTLTLPQALQSQFLVCCTERGNHLCFRHLLCVTGAIRGSWGRIH